MPSSNPTFSTITHTGQVIIPVGAQAFAINVMSGQAIVAGSTYIAGESVMWTAPDSKILLGRSVAVGATGVNNRTTVMYAA